MVCILFDYRNLKLVCNLANTRVLGLKYMYVFIHTYGTCIIVICVYIITPSLVTISIGSQLGGAIDVSVSLQLGLGVDATCRLAQ